MIKLLVIKTYRKISYRHLPSKLTDEDWKYLRSSADCRTRTLPSASTLHHFAKQRLGEEGVTSLMFAIGKKLTAYLRGELDVRGYRKDSRALYVMMNFMTFQLMTLAHSRNNFPNTRAFAGYR